MFCHPEGPYNIQCTLAFYDYGWILNSSGFMFYVVLESSKEGVAYTPFYITALPTRLVGRVYLHLLALAYA